MNPLRILLAEDGLVLQKILSAQLRRLGHTPEVAANGLIALKKLHEGNFDLVLMDLEMPEMDGFEATTRLRQELPRERQPVVVALSAHDATTLRQCLANHDLDAALSKPVQLYPLTKLLIKIPRLLRERRKTN
jgi:CheY-like chemotaxis protein